jgi:tetratricopeptide (TPR) repeat protein
VWLETYLLQAMAKCYYHLGNYDLAIGFFNKSLKTNPNNAESWFGIGKTLDIQEKWYESIHYFKKALKLDHDNQEYWMAKAEAEYKTGNVISAIEAYEEASFIDPPNPKLWLNWSYVYYEQGEVDRAIEIIEEGLEDIPDHPELNYRMTAYLIYLGNYKEAFIYLENALILDFDKHTLLFDFFPELETQKALMKIIDQFSNGHV